MFIINHHRPKSLVQVILSIVLTASLASPIAAARDDKKQKDAPEIQKIGSPALLVYGGPHFDMYMGAYDMHFVSEAYLYGKRKTIPRGLLFDLMGYFVDIPLITTTAVIQHEYFGHGYRGREFGFTGEMQINPPFPYNLFDAETANAPAGLYTTFANRPINNDEDLLITLGGMESNLVAASASRDLVLINSTTKDNGGLPFYFFVNRLSPLYYILIASESDSGGDPGVFREELRNKYGDTISVGSIRAKSLTLLLDPLTFMSFPVLGPYLQKQMLGRGLMFKVGKKTRFMPGINYLLTPYGDEFQIDLMFRQGYRYYTITPRIGFGIEEMNGGLSFRGRRMIRVTKKIYLGHHFEAWYLPKYNKGAPEKKLIPGGAAALQAEYIINKRLSIQAEGGYKTQGYMFGRGFLEEAFGHGGIGVVF